METTRESKIERINEVMWIPYEVSSSKWSVNLQWNCNICRKKFRPWHTCTVTFFSKVHIWDVLDWYNKVFGVDLFFDTIPDEIIILFWYRKEKRKPIEEQSDECIDYLYSLLPTEVRK